MRNRLVGIGVTVAAVSLGAALAVAQGASERNEGTAQVQPPVQQGQAGPDRGFGPGPRQGRPGPGQQLGPQGGRGRGMMGRGAGMGPQGPGRGRGPGFGFPGLALTEDQRAKITDLQRAGRDQASPIDDELQLNRKALHRELFADKRDAGKIANLSTKIAALEKQLADLHVKTATAVADVLTAEQRETMRLAEGRGRGMGRGPARPRPRLGVR